MTRCAPSSWLLLVMVVAVFLLVALGACSNDAQVASYNLSQAADNFKIPRRIVFYNGITGDYMLVTFGAMWLFAKCRN